MYEKIVVGTDLSKTSLVAVEHAAALAAKLDAELFLLHGIDISRYKIVALKSQNHFRAAFEPLAGEIIRTDPPGWTTSNLNQLEFERVRRPIWPLDRDVEYAG